MLLLKFFYTFIDHLDILFEFSKFKVFCPYLYWADKLLIIGFFLSLTHTLFTHCKYYIQLICVLLTNSLIAFYFYM